MNILVCVKQVSESLEKGAAKILNPADGCALEVALRLKGGGRVTVLSMGRGDVQNLLRELIARGADRAILVTDAACAGADTLATARVLAACARQFGPFDMILTGRRAVDGETGLTGARMACLLDMPCVTNVVSLDASGACRRECEAGMETLSVRLPALFSLCEGSYPLRLMGLMGMRRAKNAPIELITAADLGLAPEQCGLRGSPTRVIESADMAVRIRHTVWLKDGGELLHVLREALQRPEKGAHQAPEASANRLKGDVWVLCERPDCGLIAEAVRLTGGGVVCVHGEKEDCDALAFGTGASRVIRLRVPEALRSDEDAVAAALADVLAREKPDSVLVSSTVFLRGVAARLATRLNCGLTADCTALAADEAGRLVQIRPTNGGARLAKIICPDARPQMALVRPGVFGVAGEVGAHGIGQEMNIPDGEARVTRVALDEGERGARLREARLILAGGNGLSQQDFDRLGALAARLEGQMGASRAAVDKGLAAYQRQIGQTGETVSPKVYVALGISGAIQHLLGMSRAGTVIAVNTDPKAPIFGYADYGLIGDARRVIEQMEEELK